MRTAFIALALAALSQPVHAQTTSQEALPATATVTPPPQNAKSSHDEFCRVAEETYRDIINMPTKVDKNTALAFTIYRNASSQRVLDLAIAARCNITAYLMLESSHARQLVLQQQPQAQR